MVMNRCQRIYTLFSLSQLIYIKDKIVVTTSLQGRIVKWYHERLCHPGLTRTEATIRQHFTWKNLGHSVEQMHKTCHTCQLKKKLDPKIAHLPAKQTEVNPWETLCVDLIGPYTIHRKVTHKNGKKKKDLTLWCVTMVDPATLV